MTIVLSAKTDEGIVATEVALDYELEIGGANIVAETRARQAWYFLIVTAAGVAQKIATQSLLAESWVVDGAEVQADFLHPTGTMGIRDDGAGRITKIDTSNTTLNWNAASQAIDYFGTNTVQGDLTLGAQVEARGTPHLYEFSRATANGLSGSGAFLKAGESAKTGFLAHANGSIIGFGLMYDVDAVTAAPTLQIKLSVNGATVWTENLDETVQDNSEFSAIQARDVDTFVSGDVVGALVSEIAGGGNSIDTSDLRLVLGVVFDT